MTSGSGMIKLYPAGEQVLLLQRQSLKGAHDNWVGEIGARPVLGIRVWRSPLGNSPFGDKFLSRSLLSTTSLWGEDRWTGARRTTPTSSCERASASSTNFITQSMGVWRRVRFTFRVSFGYGLLGVFKGMVVFVLASLHSWTSVIRKIATSSLHG